MRQQYTPIFKNILSSRVWAQPPAVRAVWVWLQLSADPEGFVPTDMAGIALGANVPLADARMAMDIFESVDLDADPNDPNEGRIVARVKGGWLIIDFEAARERAKHEAEKARKRRYMKRVRQAAANDTRPPVADHGGEAAKSVDANPPEVDQPKPIPKPKPKPHSSEGVDPPTPVAGYTCLGCGLWRHPDKRHVCGEQPPVFDAPTIPAILHRIPEAWEPSPWLRDAARIAGVHRFDQHIARLRLGPIGGQRGVFPDQLERYIESLLGKMRTWDEVDRAKAPPGANAVPAQSAAARVKGAPPWVLASHAEFARAHGLQLGPLAKAFAESHHIPPGNLRPLDAAEAFTHYLLTHGAEAA